MVNRYKKGVRFEREIVNNARKEGKIAFRSAGSHSPFDVCVIDPESRCIQLIQCKVGKTQISKKERLEIEALIDLVAGTYDVACLLMEKITE